MGQYECRECGLEYEEARTLGIHIAFTHKLKIQDYYDKYLKQPQEGICPVCNSVTKFISLGLGYARCCSRQCSNHDPERIEKIREANSRPEVYETAVQKGKQTRLERYGDENWNNLDKSKATKLERYGDAFWSNRDKAKQTYPTHTQEVIDKFKDTHFNNWLASFKEKVQVFNSSFIDVDKDHYVTCRCNTCHRDYTYAKVTLNVFIKNGIHDICPFCNDGTHTSKAENELRVDHNSLE